MAGALLNLVADNAANRCAAHGAERATACKHRAADRANTGANCGVLSLFGHTRTPRHA